MSRLIIQHSVYVGDDLIYEGPSQEDALIAVNGAREAGLQADHGSVYLEVEDD